MADPQKLEEILATLELAAARRRYRSIDFFKAYARQQEFFTEGAIGTYIRERLFMAGNQLGKTFAGAFETAVHATGEYPAWWTGIRFHKPITIWVAGESSTLVRDGPQRLLCGQPGVEGALGTGFIPKAAFVDKPSLARGVTDAYDMVQVQHRTNGVIDGTSIINFKSYEQGRTKFQGGTVDFLWLDEEPDMDVYAECLTRITATHGYLILTFTPLKGRSDVVNRYLDEPSPDRRVTTMVIDDAEHISPEERERIVAGYPAWQREARARGVPMLGSGRIFQYAEEMIQEEPIEHIPAHWTKLWSIDFGIGHPFAATLQLWDRDNDVIHVHYCYRIADRLPLEHSVQVKAIGGDIPVAWPQDGTQREKGTGEPLADQYKKHGMKMLPDPAMWPTGGNSTEAGILEMSERMVSGRFKVAKHLSDWFEEFRLYHRKDGLIVRVKDDLMSATRVGIMAKRFGRAVPLGKQSNRQREAFATGVDFDLW